MKYVDAYYRLTGRKRRIPEKWLARNVFGDSWSLTPRSRGSVSYTHLRAHET